MAVRIFVNVRQLMHPRMVFEVRSAWLQRAGDLDKVSTDSKGTGQVVISTPILLLKHRMIETYLIHLKSEERE